MNGDSKRQLSVLMLSPQFRPLVGGYERAAERLSGALADLGLRVIVITERRERSWPAVERIGGYEVRRLPCLHRARIHVITSLFSFAAFLLRYGRDFDVWHIHQYGYHAALAFVLGRLLRRPVVIKLTSSAAMGIKAAMGSGLRGYFLGLAHRRVSACLALSDETKAEALRFGIPSERLYLIPNGVDGRQFHPATPEERVAARRELGLICDRLVLYIGRLSQEKNPLGLLDAWAATGTKAREGALLALVGDGPEWNKVQTKVQSQNLGETVHLAGERSDVATWYRAADIYVLSSDREGLSNTMIEAMASGLPIISTRVSGSTVLIQSPAAGVVVDVGNMLQLACAIESLLLDDPLRIRLGKNARHKFESSFSLARSVRKTAELYNELLNNPANRRPN